MGRLSGELKAQKGHFESASAPKVTYFEERKKAVEAIVASRHQAPITNTTAEADLNRYLAAFKGLDDSSMLRVARMIERPEFIEAVAQIYGEANPDLWNASMDEVRQRQIQLQDASPTDPSDEPSEDFNNQLNTILEECAGWTSEFIEAQKQVRRAAIHQKHGRPTVARNELTAANERLARALPFILLNMQCLTKNIRC